MAEKDQHNRFRCLEKGCNPVMKGDTPEEAKALGDAHTKETGHRTAKWAIRSADGKAKARKRNRSGYYNRYNVGDKSFLNRGHLIDPELHDRLLGALGTKEDADDRDWYADSIHPFSDEAFE